MNWMHILDYPGRFCCNLIKRTTSLKKLLKAEDTVALKPEVSYLVKGHRRHFKEDECVPCGDERLHYSQRLEIT